MTDITSTVFPTCDKCILLENQIIIRKASRPCAYFLGKNLLTFQKKINICKHKSAEERAWCLFQKPSCEPSEAAAALRNPSIGEIMVIISYSYGHGLGVFMVNARA